ncbi:enoyl-CoA hydratase/isomerase family protein [Microbacterium sp. RD1]|uniref:enoyl-CoA hydratase/isomerase family protein n=1 Tax=Microbacterium sp. RD1 TaxID=3457313 RepID=UPI003FA5E279
MTDEPDVLAERRGALGVLTLNRPRALNALTHDMVRALTAALAEWEHDDAVATVLITGAGERGLCAGGDIAALYRDATQGDGRASREFWADEYRLNARLARYPKPTVAIQDGIVLGGGIGISAHCAHRVVTERSRLGLPETGIGFIPDVGATWLLSHAPGELGTAVALTARSVGAGDAIALGLSDVFVPAERLSDLVDALEAESPASALAAVGDPAPDSALLAARSDIDAMFAGDSLGEILARFSDVAGITREALGRVSPIAAAVTLASLRRAAALDDLEQALVQEYRVSVHALHTHDFIEGVRAQIIDKDRSPAWSPARLGAVTRADVTAYFEPPPGGDLAFTKEN